MKIDNSIQTTTNNNIQPTQTRTHAGGGTSGTSAGDSVNLTPLAAQLKSLETKLANTSVVDSQKVDAIKEAIRSGQFQVNSEKVADGLLASVKELVLKG